MDQVPAIGLPDFALPGFTTLLELTMAAQQMDHDEAIVFLEQRWEQNGLGGVRLNQDDDGIPEGDEDDQQQQSDRGAPPPHGVTRDVLLVVERNLIISREVLTKRRYVLKLIFGSKVKGSKWRRS